MLYIRILFSVSMTGTAAFCIYLVSKRIWNTKISASFQYILLKLLLLLFILPFSLIKSFLCNILEPVPHIIFDEYVYLNNAIVQTGDGYFFGPQNTFYKILFTVWMLLLTLLLCFQLYRYLHFRRNITHKLTTDTVHQNTLLSIKTELHIRRHVPLYYCNENLSPYTYGLYKPAIVITQIVPESDVPMAIRHELQHIRSHDFLFRAIAFFVVLFHCWNPFIYLLWNEFCLVQEAACDEKTTASFLPEEVQRYGHFLIDTALLVRQPFAFTSQLANSNKKNLHNRITYLSKRFVRKSILASVLISVGMFIGATIPVAAYSPPILYFGTDLSSKDLFSTDWIYTSIQNQDYLPYPDDELLFHDTDQYVLLEDGTIIDTSVTNSILKAACAHTWANGSRKQHRIDNSGGCYVITYDVKVCTKCYATKNATLISQNHYLVCPH